MPIAAGTVAALFDTTVGVLLLRRKPPKHAAGLIRSAKAEIDSGTVLLPAATVSELIIGERHEERAEQLASLLHLLPTVILSGEAAGYAGSMGAYLAMRGAMIPFPDLLIAATAVWLDVSLLAWDGDYPRSRKVALESGDAHPGAELWRSLQLHPASRSD